MSDDLIAVLGGLEPDDPDLDESASGGPTLGRGPKRAATACLPLRSHEFAENHFSSFRVSSVLQVNSGFSRSGPR